SWAWAVGPIPSTAATATVAAPPLSMSLRSNMFTTPSDVHPFLPPLRARLLTFPDRLCARGRRRATRRACPTAPPARSPERSRDCNTLPPPRPPVPPPQRSPSPRPHH